MEDMQKQVDTALAEMDIVEEMLWPLVAAKTLHQREDFGARLPITQTKNSSCLAGFSNSAFISCKNRLFRG